MAIESRTEPAILERRFRTMGARLAFAELPARASRPFTVDVKRDGRGEYFELAIGRAEEVVAEAIDVRPEARHLLLLVRTETERGLSKEKFLCGHDERMWFVAAIPERSPARDVPTALEALKPAAVRLEQERLGVRPKDRARRRNAAYVRQGEWFFVPAPDARLEGAAVLRHEPLQRGRARPHMAEELVRKGGSIVYVARGVRPLGERAYRELLQAKPHMRKLPWRQARTAQEVFVRGRVTHPEHRTIVLEGWHRVIMNTEHEAAAMQNVAFLD